MKLDLLTRVSLVVIAASLAVLAVKSILPAPARASKEKVYKVNLVEIGSQRVWRNDLVQPRERR